MHNKGEVNDWAKAEICYENCHFLEISWFFSGYDTSVDTIDCKIIVFDDTANNLNLIQTGLSWLSLDWGGASNAPSIS